MKKNIYEIHNNKLFKNGTFFKNDVGIQSSNTGNCQISILNNFNYIYLLSLKQIKELVLIKYTNPLNLIILSDKRAIKKFDKFLNTYNIPLFKEIENDNCKTYLIKKNELCVKLK